MVNHRLVPIHKKLSDSEKQSILASLDVNLEDLPLIKRKDPALFTLDVSIGDVIEIERNSPIAGKVMYYRQVVE